MDILKVFFVRKILLVFFLFQSFFSVAQSLDFLPSRVQAIEPSFSYTEISSGFNHDGGVTKSYEKLIRSLGYNPKYYQGDYKREASYVGLEYSLGLPFNMTSSILLRYASVKITTNIDLIDNVTFENETDGQALAYINAGTNQGASDLEAKLLFRPAFNRTTTFFIGLLYNHNLNKIDYSKAKPIINPSLNFFTFLADLELFQTNVPISWGFGVEHSNFQGSDIVDYNGEDIRFSRNPESTFHIKFTYNLSDSNIRAKIIRVTSGGGHIADRNADLGNNKYDLILSYTLGNYSSFTNGTDDIPYIFKIGLTRTIIGSNTHLVNAISLGYKVAF